MKKAKTVDSNLTKTKISKDTSLYLKAANCIPTERPPIWIMRQAGRHLPEYREIRQKHNFKTLMKSPELATTITLQPIQRYKMDAAIMFSDILVTPEAMGLELNFVEKVGPVFSSPVQSEDSANQLNTNCIEKLDYVQKIIQSLLPELEKTNTPLIGFAGAPFTVASYMIEGRPSPDLKTIKLMMVQNPSLLNTILDKLTTVTIDYLNMQIETGVNAIQIFDTWAGLLSWEDADVYSSSIIKKIINGLHNPNNIPISIYAKGSSLLSGLYKTTGANIISLDWQANLENVSNALPPSIALQGNLDPFLLFAPKEILQEKIQHKLTQMKNRPGYIFNLGHGIMPTTDPESVKFVVDLIKSSDKDV